MKKRSFILALLAGLSVVGAAQAQFPGVPKLAMPGQNTAQAGAPVDIDTFLASSDAARTLVQQSVDHIFMAVGSKEKVQEINDRREAANKIADPKERDATIAKINAEVQANLNATDWDSAQKQLAAQHDQTKNKEVGAALYNLALGLLKDRDALVQGQALLQSVQSNPMNAMKMGAKLGRLKDAVSSLSSQAGNAPKLMGGIQKLSTVAKVAKLPTSSSEPVQKSEGL